MIERKKVGEDKLERYLRYIKKTIKILLGRRGIWSDEIGKSNEFMKGVLIKENCKIGNYNYFGFNTRVNNATIGNYCSIANNVEIGPGIHSKNFITTNQYISGKIIGYSLIAETVVIGNDVWIGTNVVVMQGVTIGDGAIIGANAVVTRDISDYAIAVGVPAKIIDKRFDENSAQIIKKSNWYNYDMEDAIEIIRLLEIEK